MILSLCRLDSPEPVHCCRRSEVYPRLSQVSVLPANCHCRVSGGDVEGSPSHGLSELTRTELLKSCVFIHI